MTTSNSVNFSQTRNDVIKDALSLIGRNSIGITPAATDVSLANRFLNKMVKAWQAKGLHLWTKEEGVLFLTPYVGQYDLGLSTTNFAVKDDVTTTLLTSNMTSASTTLLVENTEGMAISDKIGIVKNDGNIYWTTISSIPDNTSVTIPSPGLPADISSSQLVYTYTRSASKPMRILDARTLQGINRGALGTSQVETQLSIIPYQDYWRVGMVTTAGPLPTQCTYMPKDLNGRLYIWPVPTTGLQRIQITYERMIEDLDQVNDDFDFPSEWLECLTYQLAIRIGTPLGMSKKLTEILPLASKMLDDLLDWDCEVTSLTLQPYYEGYN